GAPDAHFSALRFHHLFYQTQTQPGAMDLRRHDARATVERIEDVGQILRLDAGSAILHADLDLGAAFARVRLGANADPAAFLAIFHGVAEQVLHAVGERDRIGHDGGEAVFDLFRDFDGGVVKRSGGGRDSIFDHAGYIERLQIVFLAGGGGEAEHLVDHLG